MLMISFSFTWFFSTSISNQPNPQQEYGFSAAGTNYLFFFYVKIPFHIFNTQHYSSSRNR